jgi:hypothetical protein
MRTLTRQQLIEQLQAAADGKIDPHALSSWAFDHFYAEEEGTVEFEPGYRRVIAAVLDDLIFGDQPGFYLTDVELKQMIQHVSSAEPVADDVNDDEEDISDVDLE